MTTLQAHSNPARPSSRGFFHLAEPRKPTDRRRTLRLFLSYAPDWILTIVVTGLFFLLGNIRGFRREFSLDDTSIQFTYAVHERVPDWLLVVICFAAPFVMMPIMNLISIRSFWDMHCAWLGLILSLGISGTVTNIVKVTVGRPRPDLIDRCQPRPGSADSPVFGLVTSAICTQTDDAIMKDGFKSFFSGHSSLSFAGLGFLSFYLTGKLHLFDRRGHQAKAWISLTPLMGAALVAISRTMDYRHHWQDVLIGSIVGYVVSWFAYRQYYPPLSSKLCHRPYSPRIARTVGNNVSLATADDDDPSHLEEGVELHGRQTNEGPASYQDVWQEGEDENIVPEAQEHHPRA